MKALVVYESMFGNTRQVAEAAAAALTAAGEDVTLTDVGNAPTDLSDVDLLVVGGPTHAFGMTRASTRADAVKQGAPAAAAETGIREWLDLLVAPERTVRCATFDTRVRPPRVPGSAARAADRRLRHLGLLVVAPAISFWVGGTTGPLRDGELERVREWAAGLVSTAPVPRAVSGPGSARA